MNDVNDLFGNPLKVGDYVLFTNMGLRLGYDGFVLGRISEIRDGPMHLMMLHNEFSSYNTAFHENLPSWESLTSTAVPCQVIKVPDQEEAEKRFNGEPSIYYHRRPGRYTGHHTLKDTET